MSKKVLKSGVAAAAAAVALAACSPMFPNGATLTAVQEGRYGRLTWTAAGADTDKAVTSYRIDVDGAEAVRVPGSVRSCALTGLANDTAYTFDVTAYDDAAGWSGDMDGTTGTLSTGLVMGSSGDAGGVQRCLSTTRAAATGGLTAPPSVSEDGHYVVLSSDRSDLVPGDTNGQWDIFGWDRTTGRIHGITSGNGPSYGPSVSGDGAYVAFVSDASDLVAGDTNGVADVFVWSMATGTITRVTNGNATSYAPVISTDGSYVAFDSDATNLVAGDTNSTGDVFVWKRADATMQRISNGNGMSLNAAITGDGSSVAFASDATNLVAGDTNGVRDIFVWDRSGGVTQRITNGNADSWRATISDDGQRVAIESDASNLVAGDSNGVSDIFLWQRYTSSTIRISNGNASSVDPHLSDDGSTVIFSSDATDLVSGDGNGVSDVFAYTVSPASLRRLTAGNGASYWPSVSGNGYVVSFLSDATDLAPGDTNSVTDVYVWGSDA